MIQAAFDHLAFYKKQFCLIEMGVSSWIFIKKLLICLFLHCARFYLFVDSWWLLLPTFDCWYESWNDFLSKIKKTHLIQVKERWQLNNENANVFLHCSKLSN